MHFSLLVIQTRCRHMLAFYGAMYYRFGALEQMTQQL